MSGTTKYTDLFNDVLPQVPGCSTDLAEYAIKGAVIEFCKDSWVWKHYPDRQTMTSGESEYALEAPAGADVTATISVALDGTPIDPITREAAEADSTLSGYVQDEVDTIVLVPTPDETIVNGLSFVLALQPRRASSAFPSWIDIKYRDALAAGARARLKAMPNKPWSDAKGAEADRKIFDDEKANARALGVSALTRAPTRTTSYH